VLEEKDINNYLLITRANPAAMVIGSRGSISPIKNDENSAGKKIKQMLDGKFVKNGGVLGIETDLNRQFGIPDNVKTWEEIEENIKDDQARLLVNVLKWMPQIKIWFGLHKDDDLEFYIYDSPFDARNDSDFHFVGEQFELLQREFQSHGFGLANGQSDPNDPIVNYPIMNGRAYQPIITVDGIMPEDKTLDGLAIKLGGLGLPSDLLRKKELN
jgi:hypothetical protein